MLAATATHLFVGQARQLPIRSLRNVLRPPLVATLALSTTISSVAVQDGTMGSTSSPTAARRAAETGARGGGAATRA